MLCEIDDTQLLCNILYMSAEKSLRQVDESLEGLEQRRFFLRRGRMQPQTGYPKAQTWPGISVSCPCALKARRRLDEGFRRCALVSICFGLVGSVVVISSSRLHLCKSCNILHLQHRLLQGHDSTRLPDEVTGMCFVLHCLRSCLGLIMDYWIEGAAPVALCI